MRETNINKKNNKRPAYLWDEKIKKVAAEVGDMIRDREKEEIKYEIGEYKRT